MWEIRADADGRGVGALLRVNPRSCHGVPMAAMSRSGEPQAPTLSKPMTTVEWLHDLVMKHDETILELSVLTPAIGEPMFGVRVWGDALKFSL